MSPYHSLFVHIFSFFPHYFVPNYLLPPLYIFLCPTCNKSFGSFVYSSRKLSKTTGKAVSWSPCRFARRQTLLLKHSSSVEGVRYLQKSAGKVHRKIKDVGNCFGTLMNCFCQPFRVSSFSVNSFYSGRSKEPPVFFMYIRNKYDGVKKFSMLVQYK